MILADSQTIKKAGLKVTPMRLLVLSILRAASRPLLVRDLVTALSKKDPSVDTVTVYRTLKSFEEKSVIRSIFLGTDALSYELADDHHHHIVCLSCGVIEGFDACAFEKLGDSILKNSKKFKAITKHSFELFGTCSGCVSSK